MQAAVGLALVALIVFRDALRGWTLAYDDLQYYFFGQLDAFVASVSHGSWPLWDPFMGFGQPLLADPGTQVLYPPTWLNLVVPPETYMVLYAIGHLFWAGLGVYALSRKLGFSGVPAWFAGAGWMASGPLLSHVQRWQHFASVAWMPWIVLAALRCVRASSMSRILVLAGALALQWLAGSVDIAAATLLIAFVWTVAAEWERPDRWRALCVWAPVCALATALTAALLLPALDLLRNSARSEVAHKVQMWWAIHPWRWIESVAPLRPDELPLQDEMRSRLFGPSNTTIVRSLYVGTTLGGFALFGLWASPRRRLVFGLLFLTLASALAASAPYVPTLGWITGAIPGLSLLRFPGKLTLVMSLAWALLAGAGAETWVRSKTGRCDQRLIATLGVVALPAAVIALLGTFWPQLLTRSILQPPPPGAHVMQAIGLEVLLCTASAVVALLVAALAWFGARSAHNAWTGAAVLLAVAELLVPNHRLIPMVPADLINKAPETALRLRQHGAQRIHVFENDRALDRSRNPELPGRWDLDPRSPLPPEQALALGLDIALAGRSASRWGLPGSFTRDTLVAPTRDQFRIATIFAATAGKPGMLRLLQAGGVTHVVAREQELAGLVPLEVVPSPLLAPIRIFQVPDPLPRTYVVGALAEDSDNVLGRFLLDRSFDLSTVAVVEGRTALRSGPDFKGTSRITAFRPDAVEIEAELSAPGEVVLLDLYDPGWRATVDGRTTPVARANGAFRAVAVPGGRHIVQMRYRPPAAIAGALVSALALTAFVVAAGFCLTRRRG